MSHAIFKEIREVEAKASKVLAQAKEQSDKILKDAHTEAFEIASRKDEELKTLREKELQKSQEQAAKLRQKVIEKAQAEGAEIRARAAKKKEKAISLVLDGLSELIGA